MLQPGLSGEESKKTGEDDLLLLIVKQWSDLDVLKKEIML